MQNKTNDNILTTFSNCFLNALYFDGGVSIAFDDYNLKTPIEAGFLSLATREIFNEYLPYSGEKNEFSYSLSILGGAIGGAIKYGYKSNNMVIGAYNNALYEAFKLANFNTQLTTYFIEITDQVLSNYISKPKQDFSLFDSIKSGFYVAFVLNGIGDQILPVFNEYILDPIGNLVFEEKNEL